MTPVFLLPSYFRSSICNFPVLVLLFSGGEKNIYQLPKCIMCTKLDIFFFLLERTDVQILQLQRKYIVDNIKIK